MVSNVAEPAGPHDGRWAEYQYDHHGPDVIAAPFDLWQQLRRECPVLHSDKHGGFWFVSPYEAVREVVSNVSTYSTANGITLPAMPNPSLPACAQPPLHRRYRAVINPALSPRAVRRFEPWMRELARTRAAAFRAAGRFDICDYAEWFAKASALRIIGFQQTDLPRLDGWARIIMNRDGATAAERATAGEAIGAFFRQALLQRAREGRQDDLLSALVDGTIDGRALTLTEQASLLEQLTFGALHTTGATIAGALLWLADHPADRRRLREEPGLMETAVDEFVRHVSPVTHLRRVTTREVDLAGTVISEGESVLFGLGSANHDETVFPDPDEVVLDRFPNHHLGFGSGPHRCAGSHLARLGIQVGLEEFLAAIPDFVIEDHMQLRWEGGEGRSLRYAPARVSQS